VIVIIVRFVHCFLPHYSVSSDGWLVFSSSFSTNRLYLQSGLAVCPLHLVEMHSIAAVGLMFIWTSYFVTPCDFCIWKVDNESAHLAYSLLELTCVRLRSFSLSKDFVDTHTHLDYD